MNAELIAVGTELLLGDIADTDGQFISQRLSELGINVFYHTVVGDNPARLKAELERARSRSDLIITTGGLGPTYDDLTKETVAEVFGKKLVLDRESLERIEGYFARRGRVMTENNRKQALLPEGCEVFANDWGTAPGCAVTDGSTTLIMLPGPPSECQPMMEKRVMPYLRRFSDGVILSRLVRVFGLGESAVEARLRSLMESSLNPSIAPYAKEGEVLLRVTAKASSKEDCETLLAPAVDAIVAELGDAVYGVDVDSLEQVVLSELKKRGLTLATAESCSGGLLSKRLTDLPGASEVFPGGAVSYSNAVKTGLLGVPEETLRAHGAVSSETAAAMALGAARVFCADLGVSLTGIAGPAGGSEEKPVGTVWCGIACRGRVRTLRLDLGGPTRSRGLIRRLATSHALFELLSEIKNM